MSISATVCCSILYFASLSIQALVNVLLECHIFDKADELSDVLDLDMTSLWLVIIVFMSVIDNLADHQPRKLHASEIKQGT